MADDARDASTRTLSYAYGAVLRNDESVGTAFLVDKGLALTCAHVAYLALTGQDDWKDKPKPAGRFALRFPQCRGGPTVKVEVLEWFSSGDDDFALLRIVEGEPSGALVAPVSAKVERGDAIRVLGFPKGVGYAVPLDGKVRDATGRLFIKIDDHSMTGVAGGFSGAPVWSESDSAIIGMVSTVVQKDPRLASVIPMSVIFPRLQSVGLNAGVRSRVRMAFEAPRNEGRCKRIRALLKAAVGRVEWPSGWRPSFWDEVETDEEGDLTIFWMSFWSAEHPLNQGCPDDGDVFYTVSLRPTGRTDQRNICELAVVWSGRGVRGVFAPTVSQADGRAYLNGEMQRLLNERAAASDHRIQPSSWYGVELASDEYLPDEPDEAFAIMIIERLARMATLFQQLIEHVEKDLGIVLDDQKKSKTKRSPAD